jgi:hypothetical protein
MELLREVTDMHSAQVEYETHIGHIVRRAKTVTWLLLFTINGACVQRYAVDYTLSTRSIGPEKQQNVLQLPSLSVLDMLSEAKTVAFAPPDKCLEASAGGDIAGQHCGEVMTALEQEASASGFQVVSWQAIRGNEPALNYARRFNIDIIFEINRLGADDSLNDYTHTGSLSIFQVTGAMRQPLAVSAEVMARCQNNLLTNAEKRARENSVVLDMNMISVRTGLIVWNYRRLYRNFLRVADVKDTEYFEGIGPSDSIICKDVINIELDKYKDMRYDHWNFNKAITGRESSSELLHRATQLAAFEFIELLALMQTASPHEKHATVLKTPERPKWMQGRPDSNCETAKEWLRTVYFKQPPSWYATCPKS